MSQNKEIYIAGGCFWGTEHFFSLIPGVISTEVGYANSNVANPTYEQVCTGKTGASETVRIIYDQDKINLDTILKLYFLTIDPTSINRQGNDIGTQYRTGIYFVNESDAEIIDKAIDTLRKKIGKKIVIEHQPLSNFYPAEEYHQRYLYNNPGGYCHIPASLFEIAKQYSNK